LRFSRQKPQQEFRIDLTSLIDVVFLLIIFFMVTTTFQARSGISVKLPEADSEMPAEECERVVISLREDGSIYFQGAETSMEELAEQLAAAAHPNTLVVIRADERVTHGRVVSVMDAARNAGLTRLAIATVKKPSRLR